MSKVKKLKREDHPYLTDEQFDLVQEVNDREGEGPNF